MLVATVFALAACSEANLAVSLGFIQPAAVVDSPVTVLAPFLEEVAPVPAVPGVPGVLRVGLMIPLSGSAAGVGRDLLDAAQLALFDFTLDRFELRIYDTGSNPVIAASAAARAQQDGVRLLLGPLFSDAVSAAAGVMRPQAVPVYAFSNDRLVGGNGVYVAGFFPEAQIARTVDFAARRGMTRFASLASDDVFGRRMTTIFADAVIDTGGEVVEQRFFPFGNEGMTATVRALARYDERAGELKTEKARLKENDDPISKRALKRLERLDTLGDVGFEALMLPEGGEQILQLSPLLAFFDIDPVQVKLLGTWVWDDPALGKEPSMLGAWFAAPPRESRLRFVERFREAYGREPDRLATLAYDGVALAAVLAQKSEPGGNPYASAKLENADGFAGVDGIFRLHATGEVERGLSVLEIGRDGPREIDRAPTSFAAPVAN
jgi:ABC-type branched-subunit amino acid transport system substrate-binding protein